MALYAAADDEGALLEYLAAARDPLGAPMYEPLFALRVARQGGCLTACVQLLCELALYEARARALPRYTGRAWPSSLLCFALGAVRCRPEAQQCMTSRSAAL